MNIDVKYLKKKTSKSNPAAHKKNLHYGLVGFIPGMQSWFNIQNIISGTHHIS